MLVAMRLINCQSWEDNTLEFSKEKPNILIADNNTGKSVLMKMLKITANPKVYSANERKELIRYGEESATLMCAFDDGAVSMTVVYPERVIYRFRQSEEQGFVSYNEPPQIMLDHLGLITNKNIDFIANIIDMDQDLYLVNTKSSGNVAMLKLLAEEPVLGEVLQKIEELTPRLKDDARLLTLHRNDLEESLSKYQYIDVNVLEQIIQKADITITLFDKVIELCGKFTTVANISFDNTDYSESLTKADCVLHCKRVLENIDNLKYDSIDYSKQMLLTKMLDGMREIVNKLDTIVYDTLDYDSALNNVTLCGGIHNLYSGLQTYEDILTQLREQDLCIKGIREEISTSGKIIQCPIKGDVLLIDEKCVPYY